MTHFDASLAALAAALPDGSRVAIPPDYSGVAMAATRALVARGARDLRLIAVPQAGFQADILIGAGCVGAIETAGVNLGEYGLAPRYTEAIERGALHILDATCPAVHAGLQAAEKGIPFMPLRGILGSDLLRVRSDWRVIDNPYGSEDPIVLVPAIRPDVALFHARWADTRGNVWIGVRRELMTMAHAAAQSFVTVEAIREDSLLEDPALAAGTISSLYIERVCLAPGGMRPLPFGADRGDDAALAAYARAARTQAGFDAWLAAWLAAAA
ncbi:MAG TPA: CoA transferase [Gammaproteobacteria bacterium]|nr:CoA transferase [Gammaproteobacteria bacterium]